MSRQFDNDVEAAVARAAVVVEVYTEQVDDYDRTVPETLSDAVADMLTDLMHYCLGMGLDFGELALRAVGRFTEEGVQVLNTGLDPEPGELEQRVLDVLSGQGADL